MSTLLMSTNLVEPFFSAPTDPKEYLHSFSDSLMNFSPAGLNAELNHASVAGSIGSHHHHLDSHHHMVNTHSALSDIFKCEVDDGQYEDFHNEHHTLCSPCLMEDYSVDVENNWTNKPPDQWQPLEVADWIRDWARRNEIQDIEVAHLLYNQMPGSDLCQMQREYFTSVCPQYGNLIYDSLQSLVHQFRSAPSNSYMSFNQNSAMQPPNGHLSSCPPPNSHSHGTPSMATLTLGHAAMPDGHLNQAMDFFPAMSSLDVMPSALFDAQTVQLNYSPSYTSVSDSDRESTSSNLSGVNERRMHINSYYAQGCLGADIADTTRPSAIMASKDNTSPMPVSAAKRNGRRGRPPKKEAKSRSKGNGKLWEFIRDLLLNPVTNPSLIRWERREDGIFKFIQSDKVAKMWGERKQNPRMTYEKLSRAMRYYYKSQVLLPVFGRRLVYKFGPNATGWRPQFDMPKPPGFCD